MTYEPCNVKTQIPPEFFRGFLYELSSAEGKTVEEKVIFEMSVFVVISKH